MKETFPLTAFQELGLTDSINRALTEERYETPTPIQAQTIPHVLAGRDVVGIAQTGTGKTAAFALPILNHLAKNPGRPDRKACRILVLSPTRELSGQIVDSFRTYGRHQKLTVALAIGGVSMGKQVRAVLPGVDVLVATPGRLLDLVNSKALMLEKVEIFVLDEADRMLDMGFIHDIRKIVGKLPAQRQTLFFSATMPPAIEELGRLMLRNPARVAVVPQATTAERIAQRVMHVEKAGKPALLAQVLKGEPIDRAIVFTRTKHGADRVVRQLGQQGLVAEAIHGNKSQGQRERALASFRNGRVKTLVATDIAARGIDVDGVSHVINYDLPNVPESYVHRIGRTARAGAEGIAISFCDHEERAYLRDIEKLIRMQIPSSDNRGDRKGEARQTSAVAAPHVSVRADGRSDSRSDSRSDGRQDGRSEGRSDGRPEGKRDGKPFKRAGQRRRRREAAARSQGHPQSPAHELPQISHSAAPKPDSANHSAALSSVGFMQDRSRKHRPARRDAQVQR